MMSKKSVFEQPIHVPQSPFWEVFHRFGRDEVLALIVSVVGTAVLALFTSSPLVLALAGPIIEKVGFFPAHIKEAWDVYRTTQKEKRKSLRYYVRRAFRGSMTSLLEDVLVHDPLYILGVYLGIALYPSVPVWMLAAVSFVAAVVVVALLEVLYTECRYLLFKCRLQRWGFGHESYYESRFVISRAVDPHALMEKAARDLGLERVKALRYEDQYMESNLPHFSGRQPKVRLRRRTTEVKKEYLPSAEVTYTRASEHLSGLDQYRFFPIQKDKFSVLLNQETPARVQDVRDVRVRRFLMRVRESDESWRVEFNRLIARDQELFVSADVFTDERDFYVLEIKVYRDVARLVSAMRYVMREFAVSQTTRAKGDV